MKRLLLIARTFNGRACSPALLVSSPTPLQLQPARMLGLAAALSRPWRRLWANGLNSGRWLRLGANTLIRLRFMGAVRVGIEQPSDHPLSRAGRSKPGDRSWCSLEKWEGVPGETAKRRGRA